MVILDCPQFGPPHHERVGGGPRSLCSDAGHFLALQGVGRLLETVGRVVRSVNQQLQVTGIILCMHEKQTTLGREIESDLEQFLESTREVASLGPTAECCVQPFAGTSNWPKLRALVSPFSITPHLSRR